MNILMHICCGPCAIYPLTVLRSDGHEIRGFFYNPNIHPYREFRKRLAALKTVGGKMDLEIDYVEEYGLKEYLRKVVYNEEHRCPICYEMRLLPTVRNAKLIGADAFSTTLLYSRYQNHDLIRTTAERLADEYDISFYYQDFREGWRQGIEMSIRMEIYRQPYCGCIYSEQERYDKKAGKKNSALLLHGAGPEIK